MLAQQLTNHRIKPHRTYAFHPIITQAKSHHSHFLCVLAFLFFHLSPHLCLAIFFIFLFRSYDLPINTTACLVALLFVSLSSLLSYDDLTTYSYFALTSFPDVSSILVTSLTETRRPNSINKPMTNGNVLFRSKQRVLRLNLISTIVYVEVVVRSPCGTYGRELVSDLLAKGGRRHSSVRETC